MVQGLHTADACSAGQEVLNFNGIQNFITEFTKASYGIYVDQDLICLTLYSTNSSLPI